MKDVVTPLSEGAPAELVCQRLKKKDEQICSLRHGTLVRSFLGLSIEVNVLLIFVCLCFL
jgi:hypothetical protein